jgi:hypothetical protein
MNPFWVRLSDGFRNDLAFVQNPGPAEPVWSAD